MIPQILLVDDDQQLLLFLKGALEKYGDRFDVLLAGDGVVAQEQLARHPVALVVTDLKMPRMDGLALLAYMMEHYPDIPVIVLTAFSTPEMERMATQGGAYGYLEKPFLVETLVEKVLAALEREADGGTLHGVSSAMFLQLIRMEQRTCTIRLTDRATSERGILFFLEGDLIDARLGGRQGEDAAQEIFTWKDVNLVIQNACAGDQRRRIERGLEAILLDAMRVRDEAAVPVVAAREAQLLAEDEPTGEDAVQRVRDRLGTLLGSRYECPVVRTNDTARPLTSAIGELGRTFSLGRFQVAHFARNQGSDTLLLAAEPPVAVELPRKAPRDRLLDALREL